ncbi:hypothetical protein FB451DRAFT_1270220 [Mycena latifolia]|nr:hypothetical protein FB451DRAFT_1270220 [Mycena latifolia]
MAAFPPTNIFSNLPLDILDVILRQVEVTDLTSICRTSRLFRVYALDALYRDVSLTSTHSLKACFTIIEDPSIAARVKCFTINSPFNNAGSYYGVIQETLTLLPRLRVLKLLMGDEGSCQWILPTDSQCPFQLHTFLTDFQYTTDVKAFVAGQHHRPFSLVEALVPGRPVREVSTFRDRENIHADRISCLAKSTARIERLQINHMFLRGIGPELLAQTLPSLACLIANCGEPKEPEQLLELPDWVSEFFTGFPHLHCFNLRLNGYLPLHMTEQLYLATLKAEHDLPVQYFAVSAVRDSNAGYVGTRIDNEWTRCSVDEAAWVLAHSSFD